jgi:hypothetical protein
MARNVKPGRPDPFAGGPNGRYERHFPRQSVPRSRVVESDT